MEDEIRGHYDSLWYATHVPGTTGFTECTGDVPGTTGFTGYTGYTGYTEVTGYTGYTGVTGATGSDVPGTTNLSFSLPVRQVNTVSIGNVSNEVGAGEAIVINATKETITPVSGSFHVAPIRVVTTLTDGCLPLYYDADTCEIVAYDEQVDDASETIERSERAIERSETIERSERAIASERGLKRRRIQDEYAQDMEDAKDRVERTSSSCRLV